MRIVTTHLTRMQKGYVCVAGVDPETGQHVRPVLPLGSLSAQLLASHGGPFDLAALVDLGPTSPSPNPPETEDHVFDPRNARRLERLADDQFWNLLGRLARTRLSAIFGPDLTRRGAGAAVEVGKGTVSLGYLILDLRSELYVRPREGRPDQVRMRLSDHELDLDLSVTDIRLFGDDHVTPDREAIQRASTLLKTGAEVIVSVGLTRAFSSDPETFPPLHWLQVNNLHFRAGPQWHLG